MKKSKIILISTGIAVMVLAVAGMLWRTGYFNIRENEVAEFNSSDGFTVEYPSNWIVDSSRKDAPADFIREPGGKAIVAMQVGLDERLKNPAERDEVLKEAETAFAKDSRYRIEFFEWKLRAAEINNDSYMAAGTFTDGGAVWRFREVAIFNPAGAIFFLRGDTRAESAGEFGPAIDKMIFSFRPTVITAELAREKVESLPEVLEYKKVLASAGARMSIEVEDQDGSWAAHVFEIIKNDDNSSHTATFSWYWVDKRTGAVEKEI